MIEMDLFAEVMRLAEETYNEDRPEEERQRLNFGDINRILDGEKMDLRPQAETEDNSAGTVEPDAGQIS